MGNFKLPVFQYVINDDTQAVLKADKAGTVSNYAAGTDLLPGTATHLFKMEGETDWTQCTKLQLLAASTRVRKQVWATAVKKIGAVTVTAATVAAGTTFRVVTDSLDKTPSAYQNIPLEKRYQLGTACTTAVQIVAAMVAAVNADPNSPIIAYAGFNNASPVSDDSAKFVYVAKDFRDVPNIYSSNFVLTVTANAVAVYHTAEDTTVTTVAASDWVNDYENLKNIQLTGNMDFDRNAEYFPQKGQKYNSYFYKVDWSKDAGSLVVPGAGATTGESTFVVYVKQGIALDTALDAFVTDMNV